MILSKSALADACNLLDLKYPVHVVLDGRMTRTAGLYTGLKWGHRNRYFDGQRHVIKVSSKMGNHQDHTLWHELTHAMQCERDFGANTTKFFDAYWREADDLRCRTMRSTTSNRAVIDRYKTISYEVEANAVAALFADDCPLFIR